MSQPTGPVTLIGNPDDDGQIIGALEEQFHADTTPWGATVDLTLEPLRPHEITQRADYIEAVPGTPPWPASVQLYVVGNVIHIARMDNPRDGWVMSADDNDALMAAQREAGRRARSNTPAPPDAA